MKKNSKAQTTLEYTILAAAVVAFLAVFASSGGFFQEKLDATYTGVSDHVPEMTSRIVTAWNQPPADMSGVTGPSSPPGMGGPTPLCVDMNPCPPGVCGMVIDACGNPYNCGTSVCSALGVNAQCFGGSCVCVPDTGDCPDGVCGMVDNGCGGQRDCGPCPPVCPDGFCNGTEDCASCPEDCGACCVPAGCGALGVETTDPASACFSLDDQCEGTVYCECENNEVCAGGACTTCGNGTCDEGMGENCSTCEPDCSCTEPEVCYNGVCMNPCGDGTCDYSIQENCRTCYEDCPCSPGTYCPVTETSCVCNPYANCWEDGVYDPSDLSLLTCNQSVTDPCNGGTISCAGACEGGGCRSGECVPCSSYTTSTSCGSFNAPNCCWINGECLACDNPCIGCDCAAACGSVCNITISPEENPSDDCECECICNCSYLGSGYVCLSTDGPGVCCEIDSTICEDGAIACGTTVDHCGVTHDCGICPIGENGLRQECIDNECFECEPESIDDTCGTNPCQSVYNNCGQYVNCGLICENGGCADDACSESCGELSYSRCTAYWSPNCWWNINFEQDCDIRSTECVDELSPDCDGVDGSCCFMGPESCWEGRSCRDIVS